MAERGALTVDFAQDLESEDLVLIAGLRLGELD